MDTTQTAKDHSKNEKKYIYYSSQSFDIKEKKTNFKLNITTMKKHYFSRQKKVTIFPKIYTPNTYPLMILEK